MAEHRRSSSFTAGSGPTQMASMPRSAHCSARDSAPSASPTRFAISLATQGILPSFCGA